MEFLCSFGGMILDRASDGNLLYVGGTTQTIRISTDMSWEDLKQEMMTMYDQTHTIKYQLPGEDLDALVSVSCDEDLQDMMEFGAALLEGGEGSEKMLRVFLFAVNGIDPDVEVDQNNASRVSTESRVVSEFSDYEASITDPSCSDASAKSESNHAPLASADDRDTVSELVDVERASADLVTTPASIGAALGSMDSRVDFGEEVQQGLSTSIEEYEESSIEEADGLVIDSSVREIILSNMQKVRNKVTIKDDLVELKDLGSGSFHTVNHGVWKGNDMAIKRINRSCFAGLSSEQERLILESWREDGELSTLEHPNVVSFFGVIPDEHRDTLTIATEFMVNGSLKNVLLCKDKILDHRKRLTIAADAASGIEYLHSKNIIHFDLKCDNLLVDLKDPSRPICKVGDFGLSEIKKITVVSGGIRQLVPWMAPELFEGRSEMVSEKVDVYSFGIVLWEILTGEEPYASMSIGKIVDGVLHKNLRPHVPESCDREWRKLMVQCWAHNPQQRPSFTQIAIQLRSMSRARQTYTEFRKMIVWNGKKKNQQIIKNEDLEELKELGSGTFGTVYHGKWKGTDVAIKRLMDSCFTSPSSEEEGLNLEFSQDAEILSKLHHPNIVTFYGVVLDGPGGTLATVTEFILGGPLRNALLRKDKYLDNYGQLIIAADAAFGMEYLHSKNIVHFHLKCDNLLVDLKDPSRPVCKVGDFGLSKIKQNKMVSSGAREMIPWMAPELLDGSSNIVSEKVDVFSFGIVLWEILTGEEPYANMDLSTIIGGVVGEDMRPPVPESCNREWKRLMEQCWAHDPQQRPSFTQIASQLCYMSMTSQTYREYKKIIENENLRNWQIIRNEDLEELRELGSGTFGTVYHGKWMGSDVAIKRIKNSSFSGRSSQQNLEFWQKAEMLSKLQHPNVMPFRGVVLDGPGGTLATVTGFMVNGSLRQLLLHKNKYLDCRKRLFIAMDAASGMEYLHSKCIAHFNLKSDNLFVNLKNHSRPICKVGDLELSQHIRFSQVAVAFTGTVPWMAPELLNGISDMVSEKVDVFSFGIVMWEILTGEVPYANMHAGKIIGGVLSDMRPPVPESCDREWRRLMEQCWASNPQKRPSFTEIAFRLRTMSMVKPS